MKRYLSDYKKLYYYFINFFDNVCQFDHVCGCSSSVSSSGSKLYQIGFFKDHKDICVLDCDVTVSNNYLTVLFFKKGSLCYSLYYDYKMFVDYDPPKNVDDFKSMFLEYVADNVCYHN